MKITRRKSKVVKIGDVYIGGNNPIAIQSMTKTKTSDTQETIKQIKELEKAGCQIVRLAIKDNNDARAIRKIKSYVGIPLVADIHFDWRLALGAIDSGVDKIRLNPGNIYKKDQIREIARAAKLNRIPIRVGINSGSVKRNTQYASFDNAQDASRAALRLVSLAQGRPERSRGTKSRDAIRNTNADIMIKSALDYLKILEGFKFYDIVISLKSSSIFDTIEAYRKIAKRCGYPLHLGITATGAPYRGRIKSSIGLGVLLLQGIGDTIRVSLTDRPQEEVKAAKAILGALGLRNFGPEIISCPTCGRCEVDLIKLVKDLETKLSTIDYRLSTRPSKMAVMGCVVNGPQEAREADVGVAFGKKEGLLFKNGLAVRKVHLSNCIHSLLKEVESNV